MSRAGTGGHIFSLVPICILKYSRSLVLLTSKHLIAKITFSSTLCVAYVYLSFDVLV